MFPKVKTSGSVRESQRWPSMTLEHPWSQYCCTVMWQYDTLSEQLNLIGSLCVGVYPTGIYVLCNANGETAVGIDVLYKKTFILYINIWFIDGFHRFFYFIFFFRVRAIQEEKINWWMVNGTWYLKTCFQNSTIFSFSPPNPISVDSHVLSLFFYSADTRLCWGWHPTNSVTCTAAGTVRHYNCWRVRREW